MSTTDVQTLNLALVGTPNSGKTSLFNALTGSRQKVANDPARLALLAKKEDLEQKIDVLKYGKAAMDPTDYKKQLTAALVQLAQVQAELDK